MSDYPTIQGKPLWEFAVEWYSDDEIKRSVAVNTEIPTDVRSKLFGLWLAHEYRLAMRKGLELMHAELHQKLAAAEAERDAMRERENWWMTMGLPIIRAFAANNPKHRYDNRLQDPSGVHAFLAEIDAAVAEIVGRKAMRVQNPTKPGA